MENEELEFSLIVDDDFEELESQNIEIKHSTDFPCVSCKINLRNSNEFIVHHTAHVRMPIIPLNRIDNEQNRKIFFKNNKTQRKTSKKFKRIRIESESSDEDSNQSESSYSCKSFELSELNDSSSDPSSAPSSDSSSDTSNESISVRRLTKRQCNVKKPPNYKSCLFFIEEDDYDGLIEEETQDRETVIKTLEKVETSSVIKYSDSGLATAVVRPRIREDQNKPSTAEEEPEKFNALPLIIPTNTPEKPLLSPKPHNQNENRDSKIRIVNIQSLLSSPSCQPFQNPIFETNIPQVPLTPIIVERSSDILSDYQMLGHPMYKCPNHNCQKPFLNEFLRDLHQRTCQQNYTFN